MTRITLLAAAAALVLAACAKPSAGTSDDKTTIATLEKRLKKTERKVAQIERVLLQAGASLEPEPDPDEVYSVPLNPHDPILGPKAAKVTMVEAFEFA